MARGQRTNLASLANSVGDHSPVDQTTAMPSHGTALTELTPNPRNPRDDLGDLTDLESIADMQLQPAVVVTKAAYLKLY
ncbi:MAG: peptide transporter, partial [Mycobacterium sp.]